MCDDYDTDFDSEPEEFDRFHLIDDIQRINLALGADSDDASEEEEDEDEENEDYSGTNANLALSPFLKNDMQNTNV